MDDDRLDEVLALKRKASALRNRERYDAALGTLDEALQRLRELEAQAVGDLQLRALVQAELGDTFGMKGGVQRRRNDLPAALAEYKAGLDAEAPDSKSTYNLGNVVLLTMLLRPASIDDGSLDIAIATLLERLRAQTQGVRADEWWAWADLAQFELLSGHIEAARHALVKGLATGPGASEFQRPLEVLAEVAEKLEAAGHPRAAEIRGFIAEAKLAG